MQKYTINGPFEIGKNEKGLVNRTKKAKKDFWQKVEIDESALSSACGCYLFGIRAGKGIKPCYVGLAEKQIFKKECFGADKILKYNDVLAQRKGTPVLFFISKRTRGGRFAKPGKNGHQDIEYLETFMIGVGLDKNPDLMNICNTKFLKKLCVPGLLNTPKGPPTKAEKEFKKAIR